MFKELVFAGELKALELNGKWQSAYRAIVPNYWFRATGLTRLEFQEGNPGTLSELQGLKMLRSLSFSR